MKKDLDLFSSKFILPEHKTALQEYRKETMKRSKPLLTEEEQQVIGEALRWSYHTKQPICITLFGEYQDRQLEGIVTRIEPFRKVFKLQYEDDWTLVRFDDVIRARVD